jgi:nitrous oxidase accessory protein
LNGAVSILNFALFGISDAFRHIFHFSFSEGNYDRFIRPRLFAFLFIYWGCVTPQCLYGNVHHIAQGDSISAVLRNALPGDTVYIHAGEYVENLRIDTPLVVIGKNYPRIRGSYNGHVILVNASGTIIEGLKISESGTRLIDDMACVRIEADSVVIRNNIITRPLHGIYVKGGSYTILSNNRIEGRLDLIPEDRGNGIHLWNSQHNRVFDNEIFNVRDGIYFSFTNKTEIYQNYIHHVRYGLHYMYSDENNFTENLFEKNVAGAALMYSKRIVFSKNVFARCRGFRAYGIFYQSMDYTKAIDNLIIDNSRGVFFSNCNFNRLENNDIVDNDLAIQVMGNGEDNIVIHNNFINNLSSLVEDNKNTRTTWAEESGGNYWSDYQGYDLDGDGLGDVPHKIQNVFQVLETNIPEIRFYLYSPAAEILEIAERSLPILELGTEKDLFPIFRPIKNSNIPWSETEELRIAANPLFAIGYFFGGVLPFFFLLYLSRKRRK